MFKRIFISEKIKFEDFAVKTDSMKNDIDNKYSKKVDQELALSKVKILIFIFQLSKTFIIVFQKSCAKCQAGESKKAEVTSSFAKGFHS